MKLSLYFQQELESLYELLEPTGVICDVSNWDKKSGTAYPPEFDTETGLPKLYADGNVEYSTDNNESYQSLTYNVTCYTIDDDGEQQYLAYDFDHVYTAWDIKLEDIEYIRYPLDDNDDNDNNVDNADLYPITYAIFVNVS